MKQIIILASSILTIIIVMLYNSLANSQNLNDELRVLNSVVKNNYDEVFIELNDIRENVSNSFLINNSILTGNDRLFDKNGIEYSLNEILKDGKEQIVFRIHESFCSPCISNCLSLISFNILNRNNCKVIILSSDLSFNIANYIQDTNNYEVLFCSDSLCAQFDKKEIPFMFTIDSSLVCNNGFTISEGNSFFFESYIKDILQEE